MEVNKIKNQPKSRIEQNVAKNCNNVNYALLFLWSKDISGQGLANFGQSSVTKSLL